MIRKANPDRAIVANESKLITIGQYEWQVYPDEPPIGWSMDDDAIKSLQQINENLYRAESWVGRVSYVVEHLGRATMLPLLRARAVAQAIADTEAKKGRDDE